MLLFDSEPVQLLPCDGEAVYYGSIFSPAEQDYYLKELLLLPWENDKSVIFGKTFITKRKVAWFADGEREYAYSGSVKKALAWNRVLADLKHRVEQHQGSAFNACLANLYHDHTEGMGWHSDGERSLVDEGVVASLSFGATRKFQFKHRQTQQRISLLLEPGSLLVMKGKIQKYWLHRLCTQSAVCRERINLTFRQMRA